MLTDTLRTPLLTGKSRTDRASTSPGLRLHPGFDFTFSHFDWGCDYYRQHGVMMPEDHARQEFARQP